MRASFIWEHAASLRRLATRYRWRPRHGRPGRRPALAHRGTGLAKFQQRVVVPRHPAVVQAASAMSLRSPVSFRWCPPRLGTMNSESPCAGHQLADATGSGQPRWTMFSVSHGAA